MPEWEYAHAFFASTSSEQELDKLAGLSREFASVILLTSDWPRTTGFEFVTSVWRSEQAAG